MITEPSLYDFVMSRLRAKDVPQRRIARESGVPFSTVCKVAQGAVKEPSVHTIQRLADFFRRIDQSTTVDAEKSANSNNPGIA